MHVLAGGCRSGRLAVRGSPARLCRAANAADNLPLRPPDTSSPRATLQGFIQTTDDIYRRMAVVLEDYGKSDRLYPSRREQRKQVDALERRVEGFCGSSTYPACAPVLQDTVPAERLLQLKEILDRIEVPAFADIPDREAMARMPSEAVAAAEHRNRYRAHRERAACRRISGVRGDDRSPAGIL